MRFDFRRMVIFILCWMLVSAVVRWVTGTLGLGMLEYIILLGFTLLFFYKFNTIKYFCWRLKNSIRVPYKKKNTFNRANMSNASTESYKCASNKNNKSILDQIEL